MTIEQLVKHGKIERPSIGIGLINLSDILKTIKELHTHKDKGVYVAKVDSENAIKKGAILLLE